MQRLQTLSTPRTFQARVRQMLHLHKKVPGCEEVEAIYILCQQYIYRSQGAGRGGCHRRIHLLEINGFQDLQHAGGWCNAAHELPLGAFLDSDLRT